MFRHMGSSTAASGTHHHVGKRERYRYTCDETRSEIVPAVEAKPVTIDIPTVTACPACCWRPQRRARATCWRTAPAPA